MLSWRSTDPSSCDASNHLYTVMNNGRGRHIVWQLQARGQWIKGGTWRPTWSLLSPVLLSRFWWLGSRVVSVLDSGAEGPKFKSHSRRCRVTVLGKLHTHCASVHQTAKLVATLLRVAGLAESNGSLPPGLWLTPPAGWLPRSGISSGTLRSVIEYRLPFTFSLRYDTIRDAILTCARKPT